MRTARHLPVSTATTGTVRRAIGRALQAVLSGRAGAAALALYAASACLSSAAPRNSTTAREAPTPRTRDNRVRPPMAWRFNAPSGCPSRERFRQELAARSPAFDTSAAGVQPAVHVAVGELSVGKWWGEVRFENAGTRLSRNVTGSDCEEVVVALALIASLWLPRTSAPDLAERAQATPARRTSDRPKSAGANTVDRADAPALTSPATPSRAPADTADARASFDDIGRVPEARGLSLDTAAPETASLRSENDLRVHLVGLLGYASEPAHAVRGGLRAELWGTARPSSWAAAIGLAYAAGRHRHARWGASKLRAIDAQLDLCLPGVAVGTGWLRACVFGRGGSLHFSAAEASLDAARSLWRPLAALGPSLHGGFAISRAISLRAASEIAVNLVQDEFATEPSSSDSEPTDAGGSILYDTAPVAFGLSVGAAYVF